MSKLADSMLRPHWYTRDDNRCNGFYSYPESTCSISEKDVTIEELKKSFNEDLDIYDLKCIRDFFRDKVKLDNIRISIIISIKNRFTSKISYHSHKLHIFTDKNDIASIIEYRPESDDISASLPYLGRKRKIKWELNENDEIKIAVSKLKLPIVSYITTLNQS